MKLLGVFSFILGLGLLSFAGYGIYQEMDNATTLGMIAIILLIITGSSVILFVINTFSRTKIYGNANTNEDILDLPDHIVEFERAHRVSPFTIGCGIVSLITGSLMFIYTIYTGYFFVIMLSYTDGASFEIGYLIVVGFFICSIMLLIYCIRKLFFSKK